MHYGFSKFGRATPTLYARLPGLLPAHWEGLKISVDKLARNVRLRWLRVVDPYDASEPNNATNSSAKFRLHAPLHVLVYNM